MDQILQFLSSHYLALCLCLLAVQIALLVAAFRTKKEAHFVLADPLGRHDPGYSGSGILHFYILIS